MKFFRPIVALLLMLFCFSFVTDNPSAIYWNKNRPLTWNDYKGVVPENESLDSRSYVVIGYRVTGTSDYYDVSIYDYFNPEKSWVRPGHQTEQLLHHEQGHFTIEEVAARQFRQYTDKWTTNGDITAFLKKGYQEYSQSCIDMQAQYDSDTDHGTNTLSQLVWDQHLDSLMKAYGAYEHSEIRLKRK